MISSAQKRFPEKNIPDIPKKTLFVRAINFNGSVPQCSAVRKWVLSAFEKMAGDPESRGMALNIVGISPERLVSAMASPKTAA